MTLKQVARRATGAGAAFIWLIAVIGGMLGLVRYQMTPGVQAAALPRQWPSGLAISKSNTGLTLVMLLHPQCPCSSASVHELSELMSCAAGKIEAHVLFVQPVVAPANWCDGELWKEAKAVPGASVSVDRDGKDAARFGAMTSGAVLVYDVSGVLRFSGGITDGRGHEGDNAGYSAVFALARGAETSVSATPVYGCSLGVCRIEQGGRSNR